MRGYPFFRHAIALQQLAWLFLPVVRQKCVAIQTGHSARDALLQAQQKGLDIGNIDGLHIQLLKV